MTAIISIVGKSESGKTTLLENLIVELKQRGCKVAVVKHAGEFDLDREGKDSWRLSRAGSEVVVISSPEKVAILKPTVRDLTPHELARLIPGNYDLILTEGFKQSNNPKIEVHRREQGKELLSPKQQLLAVVTDEPLDVEVPQFSRDEVSRLADLVVKSIQAQAVGEEVELFVNDHHIPMNPFVGDLVARILIAIATGLKGVKEVKNLHISLRRNR